jgi:hypothetical protein
MSEKSLYDYDRGRTGIPRPEGGEWKDGFCAICSNDKALHNCVKCGGIVCSEHFVSLMGLCVGCAPVKETGSVFKLSEPISVRTEKPPREPTIQQVAKASDQTRSKQTANVFTFGAEEPQDVRQVVISPKRPPVAKASEYGGKGSGRGKEDVILFERKKQNPGRSNDKKNDDDTINIEWV